ncbi:2-acylglycerol O-acyltransferase 2-B-like [Crotalus adamanteus]|uniref:2-acylglycerol O-acyltransferase 2-B-like n=1 Tax=Crotalus adamanteus TaxID=8729 RepID=A0AAW1AZP1_CROAD
MSRVPRGGDPRPDFLPLESAGLPHQQPQPPPRQQASPQPPAWVIRPGAQATLAAPRAASSSSAITAAASSFSSGPMAGPFLAASAPHVASPTAPAATAAMLLGPAGESGGSALGNGPLGRPPRVTPWKKTNYSPGVVGLTLYNCWVSGEAIDELHERYLEKWTQLFEEHKAKYGLPQDKHLMIT